MKNAVKYANEHYPAYVCQAVNIQAVAWSLQNLLMHIHCMVWYRSHTQGWEFALRFFEQIARFL